MTGGSDFLPFIEAGIPAGGVKTGASAVKSAADRAIYGGLANAALDTCYHQPCDTVLNINTDSELRIPGGGRIAAAKNTHTHAHKTVHPSLEPFHPLGRPTM